MVGVHITLFSDHSDDDLKLVGSSLVSAVMLFP